MEKLQICRVCLIDDVHYLIENTQYQYVYEKLTSIQLQTNDLKPRTVCYICYAKLQTIRRFMLQCLKAEKVLTEMLNNNNEIELQETIDRLIPNSFRLRATAIEQNNIDSDVENDVITQDIKHEQDDEMQDIYEPEPVVTETDLELQIKKFQVAHSGEETDIADIDEYIRKAVARLAREHKARDEKSVAPIINTDSNTDKVHQSDHKACLMCSQSSAEKNSSCPSTDKPAEGAAVSNTKFQTKKPHIKKPLNAFMLYLKELRPKVMAELCLKESKGVNRILGIRWHQLSTEEQDKYYAMARRERQLHMQRYPGWASRRREPRLRKRTRPDPTDEGFNFKKCRARYGLEQVNLWCKPCRIKKKCVRYMEALAAATGGTVPRGKRRRRKPCSEENAKPSASNDGDASSPEDLKALSTLASEPKQPEPTDRAPIIRSLLNLPQKSIPEPQTLSRGYINPTLNEKNPSIGWSATMSQTDFRT